MTVVGYCNAHRDLGEVLHQLSAMADARELWEALESSSSSEVRELAHTMYFKLQAATGKAAGLLHLARGDAKP